MARGWERRGACARWKGRSPPPPGRRSSSSGPLAPTPPIPWQEAQCRCRGSGPPGCRPGSVLTGLVWAGAEPVHTSTANTTIAAPTSARRPEASAPAPSSWACWPELLVVISWTVVVFMLIWSMGARRSSRTGRSTRRLRSASSRRASPRAGRCGAPRSGSAG